MCTFKFKHKDVIIGSLQPHYDVLSKHIHLITHIERLSFGSWSVMISTGDGLVILDRGWVVLWTACRELVNEDPLLNLGPYTSNVNR